MKAIEGGVTAPAGFTAAGTAAGIKKKPGEKDCALIVSESPATAAGVFTTNVMKSPPVHHNIGVCKRGVAQAVFINSGNANAATGEPGHRDVAKTAHAVAVACSVEPESVCICSTGVIGVPLPMENIERGVEACAAARSPAGSGDAALAIMTTDTVPKEFAVDIEINGRPVRLGAIAKGSGMVCPNMATMICVVTTDAAIDATLLREILCEAVDVSFHQMCVDNDLSTSDTVLVLANGHSGVTISPGAGSRWHGLPAHETRAGCPCHLDDGGRETFARALTALCQSAAKALVRDGEGATKFVEIDVCGAPSDEEARRIARAIGVSQLCKTAFFGEDPNWGRFACAAGYSGVLFDPAELDIYLDDLPIAKGGMAAGFAEEDAAAIMKRDAFRLGISIGSKTGRATFWTSDLSHGYVSINADYRT